MKVKREDIGDITTASDRHAGGFQSSRRSASAADAGLSPTAAMDDDALEVMLSSDRRAGPGRPIEGEDDVSPANRPDIGRLVFELQQARETIKQREAELEAARADLATVRLLAKKLRQSIARSLRAIDQWRFASAPPASALPAWAISFRSRKPTMRRLHLQHRDMIEKSGMFDAGWYRERYSDVAAAGMDPLFHFIEFGATEGRDPHPLFDSDWYLATYPEVALAGTNPLIHYLTIGHTQGFDPNPLFHTKWYLEQNPDAAEKKVDALLHYIEHAAETGRNPNPYFDSAWYREQNPDVGATDSNPLIHYLLRGGADRRDPHPLFDTQWYLSQYPRVANIRMNPLQHYLTIGAFDGCQPAPPDRLDPAAPPQPPPAVAPPDAPPRQAEPRKSADDFVARSGRLVSARTEEALPARTIEIAQWRLKLDSARLPVSHFSGRIGVFIHLYYDDVAEQIAESLHHIPFAFDVYLSTDSEEKKAEIEIAFEKHGLRKRATVKVLPNLGWDIAPFLLGFAEEFGRHDICLKLHAKKSRHHSGRFGLEWREHLFSELIGDRNRVAYVLDCFNARPDLGVMMAHHWPGVATRINVIGANYRPMRTVLDRIDVALVRDQRIEFPSGSMFWFRAPALASLFKIGLTWEDFADCYANDLDATIAHGIERSFLFFAASAGFKWAFLPRRGRWANQPWRNRLKLRRKA